MTCRLFIDEVGNNDVKTLEEQFLSITGIITKKRGHDHVITPEIEKLKTDIFGHNPETNLSFCIGAKSFGKNRRLNRSGTPR
jgi:hypothetical protein